MKLITLVLAALTLSGCALSKAPMICTFATAPEVERAATAIMGDVPDGKDKDTASLILRVTKLSADAGCVAAKAVEAQKQAQ